MFSQTNHRLTLARGVKIFGPSFDAGNILLNNIVISLGHREDVELQPELLQRKDLIHNECLG
jgi:hypothetical protein